MVSPLLRLSADVWPDIATFLDFDDVKCLLLVGNRQISQAVGSSVRKFELKKLLHSIDLESILATANATPHLHTIIISPIHSSQLLLKPLLPLHFPPKLTRLVANFRNSLDFFLDSSNPICMSELVPTLTSLKLQGGLSGKRKLRDFKIPHQLQSLEISGVTLEIQDADEIAGLPRALLHLHLRTPSIPHLTENVWPPQLSTLLLANVSHDVVIEHLPRSLTNLSILTAVGRLATSFSPTLGEQHFAFPWRRFFPELICIFLSQTMEGSMMSFVRSLVAPDAYNASEVNDFLSRGFWRSPQLDATPASGYPLYENLSFYGDESSMLEVTKAFAPYLQKLSDYTSDAPFEAYKYLPSCTTYDSTSSVEIQASDQAPTHLKNILVRNIDVVAVEQLQSLEICGMVEFNEYGADPSVLDHVRWPSSLIKLHSSMVFNEMALLQIPSTLTKLAVAITNRNDWSVLASHLVCLRQLVLDLSPDTWYTSEALEPMQSTSLEELELFYTGELTISPTEPFAHEFFGNTSTLPPSLTHLRMRCYNSTHELPLTVIPILPRQLRDLSITGFVNWTNSIFEIDPNVACLTPSELILRLPPRLECLTLMRFPSTPSVRQKTHTLTSLPPGLKSFGQEKLFPEALDKAAIVSITDSLPPRLSWMHYDAKREVYDAYMKRIRPYLLFDWNSTSQHS